MVHGAEKRRLSGGADGVKISKMQKPRAGCWAEKVFILKIGGTGPLVLNSFRPFTRST